MRGIMTLIEISRTKKNKLLLVLLFIICSIFLAKIFFWSGKNNGDINTYLSKQLLEEEFLLIKGKWKIVEYLDTSVEFHGIDTNIEKETIQKEKSIVDIKNEYLGKELDISEKTLTYLGAPDELGYYYSDWNDLFFIYRQPLSIGENISPPFICISFKLKKDENKLNIILDTDNKALLSVKGYFFKLEKVK